MRFDATTGHGGTETTTALAGAGQAGVAVLLAANHIPRITKLEVPVSGT
ncbi:hypothetical protein [Mycolicibacterium murale]|jgi:hypothetical protein|nr:hypothetical protein [Mycolicibacterium murale]MCV7183140.1 hypothetical protein [Mycolicibacterium murale]